MVLLIKMPKIHVKHMDSNQDNFAAMAPDAINPGNAAGIAIGQIKYKIVPEITASKATTTMVLMLIRKPVPIFSNIVLIFNFNNFFS